MQPLIVMDEGGVILDTLAIYPHMPVPIPFGRSWGRHPLHRYLRPTMASDGARVLWIDDRHQDRQFVVMSGTSTSALQELFAVPYSPVPLAGRARERVLDDYGTRLSSDASGPAAAQQYREAVQALEPHLGDHFPPVRNMVAGRDGSVWLLREERDDDVDLWEVYQYDGTLLMEVRVDFGRYLPSYLAPRIDIHEATLDEIWASTRSALDEVTLHRFSVVSNCESG
ncbi:hypothetical protein WI372_05500 [Gemmatimonadota bacterium DH-20]|uniref:Uncharacterized protein n=1 Tax=Gaopeijia maritima TaxID=3119007 RepID=A0ABU9E8G8_9BACT